MPYKSYYLNPAGKLQVNLSVEEIGKILENKEGLLWVDICETSEKDFALLIQPFNFHHLTAKYCLSPDIHPPKIDDFGNYLFITIHGINYSSESDIVEMTELAIYAGPNYIVSNHNHPLLSVESIKEIVLDNGRLMTRGVSYLAYVLIDSMVDNIIPTIDKMGELTERIENEVIRKPQQSTLEATMKLKRSSLRIHRIFAPQCEIINKLSRGEFQLIPDQAQVFYRDIYDHLARIDALNQAIRDRADNALMIYLSSVAHRQNESMRVLSMVATIFLPLTLVAGIYGMNFQNIPELSWRWGYFAVLGFMGLVILGTVTWFWTRRWITWGHKKVGQTMLFTVEPKIITERTSGKYKSGNGWI